MTTKTEAPSLDNPTDVRLATECVTWHQANCRTCTTTDAPCTGAAENMAFLEGHGFSWYAPKRTPEAAMTIKQRRDGGSNSVGAAPVSLMSDAQARFLRRLLDERNVAEGTERQQAFLGRVEKNWHSGAVSKRDAKDAIDILLALPMRPAPAPAAGATPADGGPTERQVTFFQSLLRDRVALPGHTVEAFRACTRRQASEMIDAMKNSPLRCEVGEPELAAGMYRVGEDVYKVQRAVHGSGKMVAKLLVIDWPTDDPRDASGRFEYRGLASRFISQGAAPMTLDEAKAFGQIYGVCCNCGATLTDEKSIEAGIGPVCAKKFS